jgi:hypothetical protein
MMTIILDCGIAPPARASELFSASELFASYTQGKGLVEPDLHSLRRRSSIAFH